MSELIPDDLGFDDLDLDMTTDDLAPIDPFAGDVIPASEITSEVWYVELLGRAGDLSGLTERGYAIFSPLLPVTDEAFQLALSLDARAIGPNDRLHLAVCAVHGIDQIVSADSELDAVSGIRRIDPLDERARRKLLRRSRS